MKFEFVSDLLHCYLMDGLFVDTNYHDEMDSQYFIVLFKRPYRNDSQYGLTLAGLWLTIYYLRKLGIHDMDGYKRWWMANRGVKPDQ